MIRRLAPALLFLAVSLPAQTPVKLYTDLGTHQKSIGSKVPEAQKYFDQGLRLVYGFNHAEAIRSFTRATELDPACAMCWWGIAYAYGPHVNAGMDSASGVAAYQAAQKARALSNSAPPWQRAYIDAVAARYAAVPPANRANLDSAYSRAMLSCRADLSERSRRERARRGVADGSAAVELLDAGREAVSRDR